MNCTWEAPTYLGKQGELCAMCKKGRYMDFSLPMDPKTRTPGQSVEVKDDHEDVAAPVEWDSYAYSRKRKDSPEDGGEKEVDGDE